MLITRQTLTDPALAAVAAADEWVRQAEVAKLVAVLDWTSAHTLGAALVEAPGLQLGGPGCPMIDEFDTWDLSCVLQLSADSTTTYVGNALELRHRLPKLWQAVLDLDVTVWQAFRITARTQCLPIAGAAQVDAALAHCAQSVTLGQVERTVATALADFCPLEAQARRERADESRFFDIDLRDTTILLSGTVEVTGVLDLADALDLDAAISKSAAQLADLGSIDPVNVRRAAAVGEIARAQLALDLETGEINTAGRAVTIYAHVNASDVAFLDATQTPVLVEQLMTWSQAVGTKVTLKPVIDLNTNLSTDGYVPGAALAEQVDLRDLKCVFPYCTRRRTDRDHNTPYNSGGPTESTNLARLCRGHHRSKTFSLWTYTSPAPGLYIWHSPAGATHVVDRSREP